MDEKKSRYVKLIDDVISFGQMFIIAIVLVFLFTNYLLKPVQVDGSSMYPTLKDKSVGFSNVFSRVNSGIERFDIVVVFVEQEDKYLVKRVVGLPGETIEYRDDVLYVNGVVVKEDFLNTPYVKQQIAEYGSPFSKNITPVKLKENEYYLLGDNRKYSRDSNFYGPFLGESIVSKDVYVILKLGG